MGERWLRIFVRTLTRFRRRDARRLTTAAGPSECVANCAARRNTAVDAGAPGSSRAFLSSDERLIHVWKTAGFSNQEIADRLGWSADRVESALASAKEKIARRLADQEPNPLNDE